jgi:ABC-2 type transport system permease protein
MDAGDGSGRRRPSRAPAPWLTVARRELLDVLVSPKFAWTFGTGALLVLLTFWVGARAWHLEQRRHEAARAADLRQMEGATDWLSVAPTVGLPPQPLEMLVAGVAFDLGRSARVEPRGPIDTTGSRYGSEPVTALLRVLDLEFVFRIVLGLFAVLLGYDAVCGERARGTLRLCFAGDLSRSSFLGGKIAGALAGLALPLSVPVGLGALVFRLSGVPMAALDWGRLALVLFAGFLYLATLLALATWISTLTRHPASAFFLALSAWVLLVLIVPRAAVSLAAHQVPVLSRDAVASARARLATELWARDRAQLRREIDEMLGGGHSPEQAQRMMTRINQLVEEQADGRERSIRELERGLLERRRAEQARQRRFAFGLARLSPAASFTLAAAELAGTSLALEDELHAQLARYQEELGRFVAARSGGRRSGGGVRIQIADSRDARDAAGEAPEAIRPAELPELAWRAPAPRPALGRAAGDLALLLAFPLAFYAAAFVTFQRYDLR